MYLVPSTDKASLETYGMMEFETNLWSNEIIVRIFETKKYNELNQKTALSVIVKVAKYWLTTYKVVILNISL